MTDDGFAEALARAAAGDPDGFDALFRRTQPIVLRYLRSLVAREADDIASETWVSVIRDLGSFRGGEVEFRAWILTLARHRMIDTARARARRPALLVDEPDLLAQGAAADTADVALERIGTAEALEMIASLPPDQAEAVLLRIVAGLDTARTAQLMDRSAGAVRVLTHRGLKTLLASLTEVPIPEV